MTGYKWQLDLLRTIKPIPTTNSFFVAFAIDMQGEKWHRDYFFSFMRAHYYVAYSGGMALPDGNFADKDRWLLVSFYDDTPDYLRVIKDMYLRTKGDIGAIYDYANHIAGLNSDEMDVVYNFLRSKNDWANYT